MKPFRIRDVLAPILLMGTPAVAAQTEPPTAVTDTKVTQTKIEMPTQTTITTTTTSREKVVETGKRCARPRL